MMAIMINKRFQVVAAQGSRASLDISFCSTDHLSLQGARKSCLGCVSGFSLFLIFPEVFRVMSPYSKAPATLVLS